MTLPSQAALPPTLTGAKGTFHPDGTYVGGTFDFIKTTVYDDPAPVIMFVHGGGFISGDKSFIYTEGDSVDVVKLVNLGFSIISVNYPLLESNETVGVIKCYNALENFLAELRASATAMNIIPDKIGYRGKSSGSAAGMYLAGRPNPPNAIAVSRPMPLNLGVWENFFDTIDLNWMLNNFPERVYQLFGLPYTPPPDASDFDSVIPYMQSVDSLANLKANPDIKGFWFYNPDSYDEPTDFGTLVHHPKFSQAFHEKAINLGWRSEYHRTAVPEKSLSQFFKTTLFPPAESKINISLSTQAFPNLSSPADSFAGWFPGVKQVRFFRSDFSKPKDANNVPGDVDVSIIQNFAQMCEDFDLEVIYTLRVSSVTLQDELDYVDDLINVYGMNVTALEYGGEFYLNKYRLGQLDNPKVIEQVSMQGSNTDYLDYLDVWVPAFYTLYPEMEHILIGASHQNTSKLTDQYRRDHWNAKVFNWAVTNASTYGKLPFSFHMYAGNMPGLPDEEDVIKPSDLNFDFLSQIPEGHAWVFTEGNYYIPDDSPFELQGARNFWQTVWDELRVRDRFNIFSLYSDYGVLGLFNSEGIKPLGVEFRNWLLNTLPLDPTSERIRNKNVSTSGGTSLLRIWL